MRRKVRCIRLNVENKQNCRHREREARAEHSAVRGRQNEHGVSEKGQNEVQSSVSRATRCRARSSSAAEIPEYPWRDDPPAAGARSWCIRARHREITKITTIVPTTR